MTVFYERNLPHIHPEDAIFFITFRLAGSLPKEVIVKLKDQYSSEMKNLQKESELIDKEEELYNYQKRYFGKFDHLLDQGNIGPTWLADNKITQIVSDKIRSFDKERYDLITFCIMSNHVHILFSLLENINVSPTNKKGKTKDYFVGDTMRLIKGATARECNLLLKRSGSFWHHESYDHYVRDDRELRNIINYIIQNPVKAGLVNDWTKWKWTYLSNDYMA